MPSMRDNFEEVLQKYGSLTYTNKGTSMLPMLRPERDVFTLQKRSGRCKENDVVLFKRNGNYILHRVVKAFDDHYTILGDNCIAYEKGVRDEDIIGVLVSFQRDGKLISVDDPEYLEYVKHIRSTEKRRIVSRKVVYSTKSFVKKLLRK